jgi:hypothetical protein
MVQNRVSESGGGGGGGGDDCSGDLMFSWHMESTTVTSGTPAGCSDGDTTATANNSPTLSSTQTSDGTYSAYANASVEYYYFAISSEDLVAVAEGKVEFDLYIETLASNQRFFHVDTSDIESIQCTINSGSTTSDIRIDCTFTGDDWGSTVHSGSATGHAEGEWLRVTYQWKASESNADHKLTVCDLTPPDTTSNCYSQGPEDDIDGAWTFLPDNLELGDSAATSGNLYIDNFQSYATSGL